MPTSQSQKKEAIAQATEQELASLAGRGVRIAGNACSPIVLVKGDLDDAERAGGELAAGADGAALRKALGAIGYAPEDFCVLASVAGAGDGAVAAGEALTCDLFRETLETLDPEAVLLRQRNGQHCALVAFRGHQRARHHRRPARRNVGAAANLATAVQTPGSAV